MKKKTIIIFNIIAVISIIIFSMAIAPKTLQNDTFYTIKIGEFILENGITMQDPFSWHENLAYTFPHWAYDVAIFLIYNLGGQFGIYLSTMILSAILGLTIYFTNCKISKNKLLSFVLTLGVMYLIRVYVAARAQLVTFILFVLTIYFIEMFLQTKKKRYALFLIIIPIIIANVHVAVWPFYFVLYLPYIAEYIISLLRNVDVKFFKSKIKRLKKKISKLPEDKIKELELDKKEEKLNLKLDKCIRRHEKMQANPYRITIEKNSAGKWLIVIFLVCTLTGLLSPLGDAPYTYLVKTMQGTTTQSINEHLPLTLVQNKEFLGVIVVFLFILIFTDSKIKLRDLFMLGGLLLLAFETRRQVSMFILICSFILNKLISQLFDKYDPEGCKEVIQQIVKPLRNCINFVLCCSYKCIAI